MPKKRVDPEELVDWLDDQDTTLIELGHQLDDVVASVKEVQRNVGQERSAVRAMLRRLRASLDSEAKS